MKDTVSLFNVTHGLVTELCEANMATVGDMGSRAIRNWLCTTRPVAHLGQQAVIAFSTLDGAGKEIRHAIFESEDGETLEITSSANDEIGWCPFMTMQIGGTDAMLRMGLQRLRRLQDAVVTVDAKAGLGVLLDAIEQRLEPLPMAA